MSGARGARCTPLTAPICAFSWKSLSTCNTTTPVTLSLYRRARRTSSSFRLSLLVFTISRWRLFRDAFSSLCRRSVFVSAGFSSLPSTRPCSALVSSLVSGLVSALVAALLFASASATHLVRRVRLLQYKDSPLLLLLLGQQQ